jgi:hypothetical protein
MGIHFSIKSDIFTVVVEGTFSTEGFLAVCREGMRDPTFHAPMRALIDARKAAVDTSMKTGRQDTDTYAKIRHCFIPRWAIVAASDRCLFEVAQKICTCADFEGVDMRAYRSIEEARSRLTWINMQQQDPFCRFPTKDCQPEFFSSDPNGKGRLFMPGKMPGDTADRG